MMKNILAIGILVACLLVGCKQGDDSTPPAEKPNTTTPNAEKNTTETGKPGGKEAAGTPPAGTNPNMTKEQIDGRAGSAQTK